MSRVSLLCGLCLLASGVITLRPDDAPLLTDEEIDAINTAGLWVADKSLIEGKTLGDFRRHRRPQSPSTLPVYSHNWGNLLDYVTLSGTFDSRTEWPGCVHGIQNEGDCAGSWAMAATDALSDRFCIQSRTQVQLSSQFIIDCQGIEPGCSSGTAIGAWMYLSESGVVTESCAPFEGMETGSCPTKCASGETMTKWKSTSPDYYVGIQSMQAVIAQGGPIESCFQIYSDFLAYRSGIYVQTGGDLVGVECAKIIGWGVQGSTNYWIGAAYFGTSWGQSGFFYMKMDQLGIEYGAIVGNPSS